MEVPLFHTICGVEGQIQARKTRRVVMAFHGIMD